MYLAQLKQLVHNVHILHLYPKKVDKIFCYGLNRVACTLDTGDAAADLRIKRTIDENRCTKSAHNQRTVV
jgi:hypothetical protein